MINLSFDYSALSRELDALVESAKEGVRPAAQAGAQVFYDEMRLRVPVSGRKHKARGKWYEPGNLQRAIYQAFADSESTEGRAVYRISVNKEKAFYWHMVEFGTPHAAAQPYIRPTFDAAEGRALKAAEDNMFDHLRKVLP